MSDLRKLLPLFAVLVAFMALGAAPRFGFAAVPPLVPGGHGSLGIEISGESESTGPAERHDMDIRETERDLGSDLDKSLPTEEPVAPPMESNPDSGLSINTPFFAFGPRF